ncbi:MAG TPA: N-acetylneuraminate synthase family protein [Spirochaetota bacterium]|nr:N-acetylneuraminate synthase family protein [Spirochaetota bacterium]
MKVDPVTSKKGVFLISEIGLNHNGDFATAERMIRLSASAGADAVKFQTYNPDKMYSIYCKSLLETGREDSPDKSIIDFFAKFCFSMNDLMRLKKIADESSIEFFSAPFDVESVDILEKINVSMYKVASSEVTHDRLLRKIASTGKSVIMSTGFSGENEIDQAVDMFDASKLSLLHCVSLYPLDKKDAHLSRIIALNERYGRKTGFSDHSPDTILAEYAVVAGATIIEKHFTISRDFECPDGNVSITPEQMAHLRKSIDDIYQIMGEKELIYGSDEEKVAKSARRSLFASRDIREGEIISEEDIIEKRPGTGIPANKWTMVIGKKALRNISKDHMIRFEDIE